MGMCLDISGYGVKKNGHCVTMDELRDKLKSFGDMIIYIGWQDDGGFVVSYEGSYTGGSQLQDLFYKWAEEETIAFLLNIGDFESEPEDVAIGAIQTRTQLEKCQDIIFRRAKHDL